MDRTDLQKWLEENRKPKPCKTCGKIFTPRNARQMYCCKACQYEAKKKGLAGAYNPPKIKDASDNMARIREMVKDDPRYGLKVAKMEGRIK